MKKSFIESSSFTTAVYDFLDERRFAELQMVLMHDPNRGAVIPATGGVRKVRIADAKRRKGKRGGARVLYLHVPEVNWIYLLDIYGKNEKDDLTTAERKVLRELVEAFKAEALKARPKRKGPNE